jgi:RNA polymerase sigma factor (sigma-70 family)
MTPDYELLRRYAETRSEAAFAELVQRHVNLVYSAARRQVNGDAHLAQDVAQTVFTDLARKAAPLSRRATLTGWLYTSAHFAAAKAVRAEHRRRDREEKFMREPIPETAPEPDWNKLRPVLDEAMHELKEPDRDAILLRYFENRPFAEIGAPSGLNENAARMRVERALEKLRAILARRGITTAAALASVISANAVQLTPASLAATLTTASLAGAGTGTLTLLKLMTLTKLKLGLSVLAVAGATTALVVQHQAQDKLRAENQSLARQIVQLKTDSESLSSRLAAGNSKSLSDDQLNELLRLRGEVGTLRRQITGLRKLQNENQPLKSQIPSPNQSVQLPTEVQYRQREAYVVNSLKKLGIAMRLYLTENNNQYATNFGQLTNNLADFAVDGKPDMDPVELDAFEFVNAGLVSSDYPQMVMLRERLPRRTPDGKWERAYGLVDGSVQTAISDDGNFDAWEKQNTFSPPSNQ